MGLMTVKADEVIQDILDKKIPINDITLFKKAFDILTKYGDNVKKNHTQIWLALMRFESDLIQYDSSSEGSRMNSLEKHLTKIWVKNDVRLKENNGKVVKPFSGIYQNAKENIWRNPLGTQKGISCFAPTDIISDISFVEESRDECKYRIDDNKCKFSTKTICNPYKFPKLLQITNNLKKPYKYKKTKWTNNTIKYLLKDENKKIPLIPMIIILYFGSEHIITKGRSEITIKDFQNEFNFSIDTMLLMFDVLSSNVLGTGITPHEDFEELKITNSNTKKKEKKTHLLEREINKFPSISKRTLTNKQKINMYYVDEIRKEKAYNQHQRIVYAFAKFFNDKGISSFEKGRADLVAIVEKEIWLFEIKSITDDNQVKQTRTAIGQLFDYEFLEMEKYRTCHNILKSIAFEKKPMNHIIELLQYIGIYIFWLTDSGEITGDEKSSTYLNQIKHYD